MMTSVTHWNYRLRAFAPWCEHRGCFWLPTTSISCILKYTIWMHANISVIRSGIPCMSHHQWSQTSFNDEWHWAPNTRWTGYAPCGRPRKPRPLSFLLLSWSRPSKDAPTDVSLSRRSTWSLMHWDLQMVSDHPEQPTFHLLWWVLMTSQIEILSLLRLLTNTSIHALPDPCLRILRNMFYIGESNWHPTGRPISFIRLVMWIDTESQFRSSSDRYVPLALSPFLDDDSYQNWQAYVQVPLGQWRSFCSWTQQTRLAVTPGCGCWSSDWPEYSPTDVSSRCMSISTDAPGKWSILSCPKLLKWWVLQYHDGLHSHVHWWDCPWHGFFPDIPSQPMIFL
jgi:hypothetical protein